MWVSRRFGEPRRNKLRNGKREERRRATSYDWLQISPDDDLSSSSSLSREVVVDGEDLFLSFLSNWSFQPEEERNIIIIIQLCRYSIILLFSDEKISLPLPFLFLASHKLAKTRYFSHYDTFSIKHNSGAQTIIRIADRLSTDCWKDGGREKDKSITTATHHKLHSMALQNHSLIIWMELILD